MPKTLLLLRHAKSSWSEEGMADHDRPLNKRGKRDAPRVGQMLRESGRVPDAIYCSTAMRARRTAELVAEAAGFTGELELHGALYLATPERVVDVLALAPDQHPCVLAVGHNPGLEQLVAVLTGENTSLPTAALVEIQLDIDRWSDLRPVRCGTVHEIWRPKEHDE